MKMRIAFVRFLSKHVVFTLVLTMLFFVFFLAGSRSISAEGQTKAKGEGLFNSKCAMCHGRKGAGTKMGPPLVHKIYEPNHHADISFHMAVQRGVRAHHWGFGDMPKINGVTEADADEIIRYIRSLQKEAGII
ncbi:MAG: cytochrome c [Deltaproteobacteria bacterium]|nr:cytochrome c [Deltaproteobacteria bacterium]